MFGSSRRIAVVGILAASALWLIPANADAAIKVFDLNVVFGAGTPQPTSQLLLILEDFGNNTIKVTVDNKMFGDPSSFVDEVYFNFQNTTASSQDPLFAGLSFDTSTASPSASLTSAQKGADAFRPDGDGLFDFRISLENSAGDADRISPGEQFVIFLKHSDTSQVLTVSMFNVLGTPGPGAGNPGPFYAAAHVNVLVDGNGDSTYLGDDDGGSDETPPPVVPEPGSMAILGGLSAIGLIPLLRRRKS